MKRFILIDKKYDVSIFFNTLEEFLSWVRDDKSSNWQEDSRVSITKRRVTDRENPGPLQKRRNGAKQKFT